MNRRTRIKICCIGTVEEAAMAVAQGADALGLVGHMPSGPGVIDDALISAIVDGVPPPIATFLLTSETKADAIAHHARRCRADTVQLVDRVEPDAFAIMRAALPSRRFVQVIHVEGEETIQAATEAARLADAILLDSGRPSAAVKELGGTGRTHDWTISRAVVDACPRPVFLAGGLNAGNVGDAVRQVRPFGVDLCTGVRTDDRLDAAKLKAFVAEVAKADAA
ncbi:MAG: phosphoribosylanthranilate isomerase [Alphaproteobacteria bacterium]|nr:phosphoribosylanthranilate isomerase [Alphaproteobacteria bacterium]